MINIFAPLDYFLSLLKKYFFLYLFLFLFSKALPAILP